MSTGQMVVPMVSAAAVQPGTAGSTAQAASQDSTVFEGVLNGVSFVREVTAKVQTLTAAKENGEAGADVKSKADDVSQTVDMTALMAMLFGGTDLKVLENAEKASLDGKTAEATKSEGENALTAAGVVGSQKVVLSDNAARQVMSMLSLDAGQQENATVAERVAPGLVSNIHQQASQTVAALKSDVIPSITEGMVAKATGNVATEVKKAAELFASSRSDFQSQVAQSVVASKVDSSQQDQLLKSTQNDVAPKSEQQDAVRVAMPLQAALKNESEKAAVVETPEMAQEGAAAVEFKFSKAPAVTAVVGEMKQNADNLQNVRSEQLDRSGKSIEQADGGGTEQLTLKGEQAALNGDSPSDGGHESFGKSAFSQQMMAANAVDGLTSRSVQQGQPEIQSTSLQQPIVDQVREKLSTHDLKSGSDQITIRLSPQHLGEIKVNFKLDDQRLRVEIVAENRMAKDSLLQNSDSLKEALARQNISMDKFDVTTGSGSYQNQGGNPQAEWKEQLKNKQMQQWATSGGYAVSAADAVVQRQVYVAPAEHAMLDLHY